MGTAFVLAFVCLAQRWPDVQASSFKLQRQGKPHHTSPPHTKGKQHLCLSWSTTKLSDELNLSATLSESLLLITHNGELTREHQRSAFEPYFEVTEYSESTDRKMIMRTSGTGRATHGNVQRLPRGSSALGRLLIDALTHLRRAYHPPITNHPSLLYKPSCLLDHLHPYPLAPPNPTSCPFSTPPWKPTNIKPRRTSPRIRSFPSFNPAILQMLFSPPSENKFLRLANLRMVTTDSQNGSPLP